MFDNSRYSDTVDLCKKYNLFPPPDDWADKILLLESSEEKAPPELYKKMLIKLKETGIFSVIKGIIVGKPMDEVYYTDYKKILIETVEDSNLPIVYNVNIGHSSPKCIIPFGVTAYVDTREQVIRFESSREYDFQSRQHGQAGLRLKYKLYGQLYRDVPGGKNEKNNFTIDFNNFVIRRRKKR